MEYLVYRSTALVTPGSAACRDIVTVAQRKNAWLELTGFLHAEDGLFIQYLEGPAAPLWALYAQLHDDDRHRDLVLLGQGAIRRRRFRDWRLGYSEADVMCFADFLEEVSMPGAAEPTSPADAIMFLMAASIRLDLGIAEPPQRAWQ